MWFRQHTPIWILRKYGKAIRPEILSGDGRKLNSALTECCHNAFHESGAAQGPLLQFPPASKSHKPRNPRKPKTKKQTMPETQQ